VVVFDRVYFAELNRVPGYWIIHVRPASDRRWETQRELQHSGAALHFTPVC